MILAPQTGQPYTVPGRNVKVQGSLALPDRDMGGFGSFTDSVSGGVSPKKISVALDLAFSDIADLQALIRLAEAVDSAGERILYDIIDRTARAFGIRQVTFTGTFSVKESDNLQAWQVSFALIEKRSTAEIVEQRRDPSQVTGAQTDGTPVTGQGDSTFLKTLDATNKARP